MIFSSRAKFSIALNCTCTARPILPYDFTPFDRANQELENSFLDESVAKLWPAAWKVFMISFFLYANIIINYIRDNRFENNAKFLPHFAGPARIHFLLITAYVIACMIY